MYKIWRQRVGGLHRRAVITEALARNGLMVWYQFRADSAKGPFEPYRTTMAGRVGSRGEFEAEAAEAVTDSRTRSLARWTEQAEDRRAF